MIVQISSRLYHIQVILIPKIPTFHPVIVMLFSTLRKLDRTDRHIPEYDLQSLQKDNFLGPGAGSRFYDNRYIFCPIDIVEDGNLKLEDGWRLPFLAGRSEACGSGGFGKVTKEVIAARHYRSKGVLHSVRASWICQ